MNQTNELKIICQNEEHHSLVQLACLNESCRANRIYCLQCIKNGDHVAHPENQTDLNKLVELFDQINRKSEDLIIKLSLMHSDITELFYKLNQGLTLKYQIPKECLFQLNSIQMNKAIDQMVKYQETTKFIEIELQKCSENMIKQLNRQIIDLKLSEINYNGSLNEQISHAQQLYFKGYELFIDAKYNKAIQYLDKALLIQPDHLLSLYIKADCLKRINKFDDAIIWADKALSVDSKHIDSLDIKAESLRALTNYNDAIKWAEKALQIDQNHLNSLYTKASSLKMTNNYKEAIKWAEKALTIDPKHVNSLSIKAESLRMNDNYKEAILWADKALQIDSKHINSLYSKGESLRQLGRFDEALQVLQQALIINPNHDISLASKGACLQSQSKYSEAIVYYKKAIQINQNYLFAKNRLAECEKQLNLKSAIK